MQTKHAQPINATQQKGRRKQDAQANPLEDYVFGKVMPQAVPIEEAVLGAAMIDNSAFPQIAEILTPDSFYKREHGLIFQAMLNLFSKSDPIDLLTVTNALRANSGLEAIGGSYYLVGLTNSVASGANIEFHAKIIKEKQILRDVITAASEAISAAYKEGDAMEVIEGINKRIFQATQERGAKGMISVGEAAMSALLASDRAMNSGGITGVPSMLKEVDGYTGGFQNSDLIILAARPGMGKTSLALTLALNAAKAGFPVGIFSLEMPSIQLGQKFIAMQAGISVQRQRTGRLSESDLTIMQEATEDIMKLKIMVDDSSSITITGMKARARRMVEKHGVKMIIVDYLQLISAGAESKTGNREGEIRVISGGLKIIAKELNVPVIALSQLSRAVEARGNKRPQLSDLRESGSIEQDADLVTFLYRPGYYNITETEEGVVTDGQTEFIIAKQRNGGLGSVMLKFIPNLTMFVDHDSGEYPSAGLSQSKISDYAAKGGAQDVLAVDNPPSFDQPIPF